jgi:putative PIN family toxin of toxin-antitoxin system
VRLVLDTNVVVSALLWGGTPYKLLQAAAEGALDLITSPALLAELRGVLAREHLARRLAEQRSSVEHAVGFYGELAIRVSPRITPRAVPRDADDDCVLAAALAGRADLVVSGDADLLSIGSFEGIGIVSAAEAVRRCEAIGKT